MNGALHLVGSVPLDTPEEVFATFGAPLGQYLNAMPDGEVGPRRHWISRVHYQVLAAHPELDVVQRPKPDDLLARQVGDMGVPAEGQQMMLAHGVELDIAHEHHVLMGLLEQRVTDGRARIERVAAREPGERCRHPLRGLEEAVPVGILTDQRELAPHQCRELRGAAGRAIACYPIAPRTADRPALARRGVAIVLARRRRSLARHAHVTSLFLRHGRSLSPARRREMPRDDPCGL